MKRQACLRLSQELVASRMRRIGTPRQFVVRRRVENRRHHAREQSCPDSLAETRKRLFTRAQANRADRLECRGKPCKNPRQIVRQIECRGYTRWRS